MKKFGIILLALLGIVNATRGDIFTKSFFRLPSDAISRSVGGSNQAYSIGAADVFTNPALLSQHTGTELQLSNMINLLSKQYMSVAYSAPINNRDHIGVGLIGLETSPVEQSSPKNVRIRESPRYQFGLIAAYSRNLFPFSVGVSVKYFGLGERHEEIFETTSGLGVDLGFSYLMSSSLKVGFIYQSPLNLQWNNYPAEFIPGRMGISAVWAPGYFNEQFLQFLLSGDRSDNESPQLNFGIVVNAINDKLGMKNFALRAGLGNLESNRQNRSSILDYLNDSAPIVTIGAGLGIETGSQWAFRLDYCFQIQEYINNKHIVTTRIGF